MWSPFREVLPASFLDQEFVKWLYHSRFSAPQFVLWCFVSVLFPTVVDQVSLTGTAKLFAMDAWEPCSGTSKGSGLFIFFCSLNGRSPASAASEEPDRWMQCRVVLCPMKCYCAHNLLECKNAIYLRTKGTGHKIWERQEVFPISKQLSFDKTIRIVGCSREEICRVENLMPVNQQFFSIRDQKWSVYRSWFGPSHLPPVWLGSYSLWGFQCR